MRGYGRRRFVEWLRRSKSEIGADVDSELSFHVEMRAAALEREGMTREHALGRARAELGDVTELAAELERSDTATEMRNAWRVRLDELRQDVRYALRGMRRRRGFAAAVVATLALGIGAATAVFAVIDGVLLRPLPVMDQERVFVAWTSDPVREFDHIPFSFAAYEQLREAVPSAAAMAAHPYWFASRMVAHIGDRTLPLQVALVTGEVFDVLETRPYAGRLLEPGDDHTGAAPVIVLGESAARRLFGSARGALDRALRVGDRTYTVIGIAPADFEYPRTAEAWTPLIPYSAEAPGGLEALRRPGNSAFDIIVRVAADASVEQARAELQAALTDPALQALLYEGRVELQTPLLSEVIVGDVRPALMMLGAAVLLVLLIAGLNVANLLLLRGVTRQRELALRAALGAGRGRLMRQLAVETLVLSTAAAVAGLLLAYVALGGMLAFAPAELPRLNGVGLDGRAAAFTATCAALAALCFGVLPALRVTRVRHERLRTRDDTTEPGTHGHLLRHALVAAQIAVTCVVLSTAGLLIRSVERLQALDLGFDQHGIVLAELAFPASRFSTDTAHWAAMATLVDAAERIPGVTSATSVLTAPFAGNTGFDIMIYGEGMDDARAASPPIVNYEAVDGGYFAALGLPILRGRAVSEDDRADSEQVVVINRAMAELYWPGADAVGRRIKWGDQNSPAPWRTVVGVSGDARYRELADVRPSIYVPVAQGIPVRPNYLMLRTPIGAARIAAPLRAVIRAEEPSAALLDITPLPGMLREPLARPRFQSLLTTLFALLGLVLSALGTYAVLAFFVQQRRREIGIRMALGASQASVRRVVLRHALTLAGAGIGIGVLGSLAAGRAVQSVLFGTRTIEPVVLGSTILVLLAASVAAALVPVRSAIRTDPMHVMRAD